MVHNMSLTDVTSDQYIGVIVNNEDPLFMGRCKVRVFQKFDDIPDDDLPWAFPLRNFVFAKTADGETKGGGGYGNFSYPKINTLVVVTFCGGDIYSPQYREVEIMNSEMQAEIQGDSYVNSQVTVYDVDSDLKIMYTDTQGLMIWHKESYMNIDKVTDIIIEHSSRDNKRIMKPTKTVETVKDDFSIDTGSGSSSIHLGENETDNYSCVKCENLMKLLNQLASMLDAKVPSSPGVAVNLVKSLESTICSEVVKMSN